MGPGLSQRFGEEGINDGVCRDFPRVASLDAEYDPRPSFARPRVTRERRQMLHASQRGGVRKKRDAVLQKPDAFDFDEETLGATGEEKIKTGVAKRVFRRNMPAVSDAFQNTGVDERSNPRVRRGRVDGDERAGVGFSRDQKRPPGLAGRRTGGVQKHLRAGNEAPLEPSSVRHVRVLDLSRREPTSSKEAVFPFFKGRGDRRTGQPMRHDDVFGYVHARLGTIVPGVSGLADFTFLFAGRFLAEVVAALAVGATEP